MDDGRLRKVNLYSRGDGLSNTEIAEKMNISEKGVEANLTRALKVVRDNLKNTLSFDALADDCQAAFLQATASFQIYDVVVSTNREVGATGSAVEWGFITHSVKNFNSIAVID